MLVLEAGRPRPVFPPQGPLVRALGLGGRILSCTESAPTPGLEREWTTKKLNVNNH